MANVYPDDQPKPHNPDILVRVLKDEISGEEVLIQGRQEEILREVLLRDWPLNPSLRKKDWYIIDSNENIVTNKKFIEFEGILILKVDESLWQ